MNLTEAQRRAIEHDGRNLQLIACAGSGKTEVVARRVVHLLTPGRPGSLGPRNIVAFTFTEKAAAELKERIVTRTREALGEIHGMADLFVGTIHAFCLDLLRAEAPEYLKYEVLNEVQQALFVDRHSRKSGLTTSTDLQGRRLKRYVDTNHYVNALAILREADLDDSMLDGCSVAAALDGYRDLLGERSYFDYSSILEAAVESLTHDGDLRRRLAERLRYVIVDEYQDVNPIQEAIVWSLYDLGARVCVVGDDDQTIYQWRGSDVGNILTVSRRYPGVDRIRLDDNFRSSEGIVRTARAFIEQNTERLEKAMTPAGRQAAETGDVVALAFDTPEQEAEHIVATAQSLRGAAFLDGDAERGLAWSDMAILLRSVKRNGAPITAALDAAGIPYVVTGMADLFQAKEAHAARQLFYFMAGRDGVDAEALAQAWRRADLGLETRALRRAAANAADARAVVEEDTDEGTRRRWGAYSLQRLFLSFLEDAGVREERVPNARGEVAFFNLGKFSQIITDYETIHYHSKPAAKYDAFASFLQYRAEDAYPEGWQDNQYANPDAVRIMTVHQAKGMEWPVVFLPALLRNRFPAPTVGGRTAWHLIPRDGVNGQPRFEGTVEDERRLFYVAMTRSRKFLHMTWATVGSASPSAGSLAAAQTEDPARRDAAVQGATGLVHAVADSEGWDVKSVTHILGLRAFGSPLLTEQIVGRGLRRTNYDVLNRPLDQRPEGYEETVDAFGIPFVGFPVQRRKRPRTGQWGQKPVWIEPVEQKAAYRVRVPNVRSWAVGVTEPLADLVQVHSLPQIEIDPKQTPPDVSVKPVVGGRPEEVMTLDLFRVEWPVLRTAFQVAQDLHESANPGGAAELGVGPTFEELLDLAQRYLDHRTRTLAGADPRDVGVYFWRRQVVDVLETAVRGAGAGRTAAVPMLGSPEWLDTSRLRRFRWTGLVAAGRKCHTNKAPCHTDLEKQFADFLDRSKEVVRWFKNERLGFSVTYYEGNRPRQYHPDFLVTACEADGREILWVIETKGEIRPNTKLKSEAAELWCQRMSTHPVRFLAISVRAAEALRGGARCRCAVSGRACRGPVASAPGTAAQDFLLRGGQTEAAGVQDHAAALRAQGGGRVLRRWRDGRAGGLDRNDRHRKA